MCVYTRARRRCRDPPPVGVRGTRSRVCASSCFILSRLSERETSSLVQTPTVLLCVFSLVWALLSARTQPFSSSLSQSVRLARSFSPYVLPISVSRRRASVCGSPGGPSPGRSTSCEAADLLPSPLPRAYAHRLNHMVFYRCRRVYGLRSFRCLLQGMLPLIYRDSR